MEIIRFVALHLRTEIRFAWTPTSTATLLALSTIPAPPTWSPSRCLLSIRISGSLTSHSLLPGRFRGDKNLGRNVTKKGYFYIPRFNYSLVRPISRFDYGEKFWVIKHKYFTCCCGTDKCRYNRSSIQGFLREYYHRMGEPMPEELLSKKAMAEPSKSSVNAAKSEGAAKKAAAASSSGEKAEKDTPSTTKDCSKKDQVVAAGDEAGPKKASKKSDKTPSRSATPNANVPAPAPAPDDAQVASEQKRKTSESGPDAPLVVVKKEVLEGKEASEDAASEDGGGGGDAKKIGRPRRAVTKKAEENAGPAGGGSANSVSASSK